MVAGTEIDAVTGTDGKLVEPDGREQHDPRAVRDENVFDDEEGPHHNKEHYRLWLFRTTDEFRQFACSRFSAFPLFAAFPLFRSSVFVFVFALPFRFTNLVIPA